MNYIEFRKSFYVEVPEIAKMTNEEVEAYREVLHFLIVLFMICQQCYEKRKEYIFANVVVVLHLLEWNLIFRSNSK